MSQKYTFENLQGLTGVELLEIRDALLDAHYDAQQGRLAMCAHILQLQDEIEKIQVRQKKLKPQGGGDE